MRKLILFRHAKAERRAASGEDYDRDLAERGVADAVIMGRVLAERGHAPDLALVSGAVRTRATWAALSSAFPGARMEVDEDLYNAPAARLIAAARSKADSAASAETGCIIVIAHNPGLHEAALQLLAAGGAGAAETYQLRQGMPTATAGVFDMSSEAPRLLDWLLARDFGGGAGE